MLDGKPSEAAALDFAEYYLQLYTYAYLTGDTTELDALGRAGCSFCADVREDIAATYGAGGHDEGGVVTVNAIRAHDYGVQGGYGVWVTARQSPNREVDAAGREHSANPSVKSFEITFALFWTKARGWRVGDVSVADGR